VTSQQAKAESNQEPEATRSQQQLGGNNSSL